MKKFIYTFNLIFLLTLVSSCGGDNNDPVPPKPKPTEKINPVSQFVYDGLSLYYYWNHTLTNKKPKANDNNPQKYFYSILDKEDLDHGWSWITDNVDGLLADFSGEPLDFGWKLSLLYADASHTNIVALIRYVFPNTPAYEAGLRRGDIITKIDGKPISYKNKDYNKLFDNQPLKLTAMNSKGEPKEADVTPRKIKTNPVLVHKVIETNGKKVGYLFYTSFIAAFNNELHDAFMEFKALGVTDLVLDLRYNGGGAVAAASYLCSHIVPEQYVQKGAILTMMDYNKEINDLFKKEGWSRTTPLGNKEINTKNPNPLTANLNLNKVYVIETGNSYSASELTLFGMRSYLDVVHIGDTTGGKYSASWTVHAYDSKLGQPVYSKLNEDLKVTLKNWAMQPIVAFYTNSKGETFRNPGYLVPDVNMHDIMQQVEYNPERWKDLGDPDEYMLAQALNLISGRPIPPITPTRSTIGAMQLKPFDYVPHKERLFRESVHIEMPNIKPEMLKD